MNVIQNLREVHRRNTAIKEALDSLPSAICYFTPAGNIKLCNTAMYDIYRVLTGRDLQYLAELEEALDRCEENPGITRDGNIFLLPDGHAWQHSVNVIKTKIGRTYTEVIFNDVTELYRKRQELQQQSVEMKKMYAELMALSGQLVEMTREQEILNMKTRLHDQMNMGIVAIRQNLKQNSTSKESAGAIAQFRRAIEILQEENTYPQDDLSDFIRDAKVAGVEININGPLPEDEKLLRFIVDILREACVNAARHADATVLDILSEMTEHAVKMQITSDGKSPEKEIVPRGGLKDLKNRIEKAGGVLDIRSLPELILTVTLPVPGQGPIERIQI